MSPIRLSSAHVLAGSGVNLNGFALVDEQRHLNLCSGLKNSGLGSIGSGITLETGIGFGDNKLNKVRRLYAKYITLVGEHLTNHVLFHKFEVVTEDYLVAADLTIDDCYSIADLASEGFMKGQYDSVYIIYTNFINLLTQTPEVLQLLPLSMEVGEGPKSEKILYEPGAETVFNRIVPEYLGGLIYGALSKSIAFEQAARRQAMNSATKNADEIIAKLDLQYNRARQGAITQEITEIVAGSNVQS